MKKNQACIPPSFLAKADEGTVQYAFDHANNFTLLSVAPKKQEGLLLVHYAFRKRKRDKETGKKKYMYFTTRKELVWRVKIKCAACTPRQEKQTVGQ